MKVLLERGSSVAWRGASTLGSSALQVLSAGMSPEKEKLLRYKASYLSGVALTKPRGISLELSTACNLHCKICHQWKDNREKQALDEHDVKGIIDDIAAHFPHAVLEFSGQEPTMNAPLLFFALEYAQQKGVQTALNTNGMVVDRAFAERLVAAEPHHISVSLDGVHAQTHDYLRHMRGSHAKVVRAVQSLVAAKESMRSRSAVAVTTVLCDTNLEEMPEMHAFAASLGAESLNYNAFVLDNSYFLAPRERYEECEFWVKEQRLPVLEGVVQDILALKEAGARPAITNDARQLRNFPEYFRNKANFSKGKCLAGYNYFHIHKLGDVTVCGKGPFLNVKQYPLHEIWHSYSYYRTRQLIKQCDVPCLNNCFTLL